MSKLKKELHSRLELVTLEFLTPATLKLLSSTERKITKDKNAENAPQLEIAEVVLVHCIIVNNQYQHDS